MDLRFAFMIRMTLGMLLDKPQPTFDEILYGNKPLRKQKRRGPRHWSGSWLHG